MTGHRYRGQAAPEPGPLREVHEWGELVGRAWLEGFVHGMKRAAPAVRRAAEELYRASFQLQRVTVDALLEAPWYRHLRLRWALRRAPQWAELPPPPAGPR